MKYSDIKKGYIYYVNFEPIKKYEFGGNHMALVLKKNNDKKTVTVVPLTTQPSGENQNKKNIGRINSLPNRLGSSDSYAVYNQVRTVAASRVQQMFDGKDENGRNIIKECDIDSVLFNNITLLCIEELLTSVDQPDYIQNYHQEEYVKFLVNKTINLVYTVIKDEASKTDISDELKRIINILNAINTTFLIDDYISEEDLKNGVLNVFKDILESSK